MPDKDKRENEPVYLLARALGKKIKIMSIWFYRKDKKGKSSVYSVTVPFEILIIILGLIAGLLVPRYMFNPKQVCIDSIVITFLGFALFFISKLSFFAKGIWNSWGTKKMNG